MRGQLHDSNEDRGTEEHWPVIRLPSQLVNIHTDQQLHRMLEETQSNNPIINKIQEHFESLGGNYENYVVDSINPRSNRQYITAIQLSSIIQQMNVLGILPSILEVGAGPSKRGDHLEYQYPFCARTLALLQREGVIRMDRFVAIDPLLNSSVEQRYGLSTISAKCVIAPHYEAENISQILEISREYIADLLGNIPWQGIFGPARSEHEAYVALQCRAYEREMRKVLDSAVNNPYALQSSEYEIRTASLPDHFAALLDDPTVEISTLETVATEPAPSLARELRSYAPFDIIYSNYPNFSILTYIPLLKNKGKIISFPITSIADQSSAKTLLFRN